MKCKICGFKARNIKKMAEHYRKKHPNRMKTDKRPKTEVQDLIKGLKKLLEKRI
jgi:hypothetical protein